MNNNTNYIIKTYDLPKDCFVSQFDNHTVTVYDKSTKQPVVSYKIPEYVDCRNWNWCMCSNGKLEIAYHDIGTPIRGIHYEIRELRNPNDIINSEWICPVQCEDSYDSEDSAIQAYRELLTEEQDDAINNDLRQSVKIFKITTELVEDIK